MKSLARKTPSPLEIRKACADYPTMKQAAKSLNDMPFSTFKAHAKKLGCYEINQGAVGVKRPKRKARSFIDSSPLG